MRERVIGSAIALVAPKTRECLYDDVHFTRHGARRADEELAALIRDVDGFPHAASR